MNKKRVRRRPIQASAQLEGPPRERLQSTHEELVRSEHTIKDSRGGVGRPWRKIDTLDLLERRGTISAVQREAGQKFRDRFAEAGLDPLWAADPSRLPVLTHKGARGPGRPGNSAAVEEVMQALEALGGISTPSGSCAWHCLGCEWTLESWALSRHWGTLRIDRKMARGILLIDLILLQKFYRLADRG